MDQTWLVDQNANLYGMNDYIQNLVRRPGVDAADHMAKNGRHH